MFNNSIYLTKGSNGFLVVLPQYTPDYDPIEQATVMAQTFKKEYTKDEVLEELGHYGPTQSKKIDFKTQPNLHVFQTFKEAVDFLEKYFK